MARRAGRNAVAGAGLSACSGFPVLPRADQGTVRLRSVNTMLYDVGSFFELSKIMPLNLFIIKNRFM
jgi:hypothetical protein